MNYSERITIIETKVKLIEKLIYGLGVLVLAQMGIQIA